MSVTEIIGVVFVVFSVAILICVVIHYMKSDGNVSHREMIVRSYANNTHGFIYSYLVCGWKVKYQSEPLISADGQAYIEYVLYIEEPVEKGDNHDSKQDSM